MGVKLFVGCKKAGFVCDKSQYREAGLKEKIGLIVHLTYCPACRNYTKRNNKLTKLLNNTTVKKMPEEDKKILRQRLLEELSK
ncbi:hypothetical protein ACH3O9_10340 [Leeuwenhoekiella sp. A16]|uniref:hypothetical protein n=1 Tax=unclassified Leeuwenhoekiella TaxID=2615029 RepID=UPI003A8115FB|tara:strand:+ start:34440 stop:34688 length:249 start_codon:yes stop_codon:yes gene_type:complete